jgi:predicted permease
MRRCPDCVANRYRLIRGRKVDMDFWRALAGAIVAVAVILVGEWLGTKSEAHADPRMWIAGVFRRSLFVLLVFWVLDVSVHNHPIPADAPYNRWTRVLGLMLLRALVAGVVYGVLSIEVERLIRG